MQVSKERGGQSLPLSGKPVAIVFGPENGAISERLVWQGIMEAKAKGYAHVYVFGFAIQPNARKTIEDSAAAFDVPATYVQATPDLLMGDLLKNMVEPGLQRLRAAGGEGRTRRRTHRQAQGRTARCKWS